MSEKPLSAGEAALAEVLGMVIADQKAVWEREWRLQMQVIAAECRATIAEIKTAAIEALMAANAPPESVAQLKLIGGGRS